MHELPITESILKIVLSHAERNAVNRVMVIHLRIGKLSDLEDSWLQRYFDYLSCGTIAEGAKLAIERAPIVLECVACKNSYDVEPADMGNAVCPACGQKEASLISGREYFISNMEVQ